MGLFGNLFGNKQEDNGLVVDLIDNGFVSSDTQFPFPVIQDLAEFKEEAK